MAKPRKRRRSGSIGSLKAALWAAVCYNLDVIEDLSLEHEVKQRACNALTQASLAYSKLVELHELQTHMATLEHLAHGNGHGPA